MLVRTAVLPFALILLVLGVWVGFRTHPPAPDTALTLEAAAKAEHHAGTPLAAAPQESLDADGPSATQLTATLPSQPFREVAAEPMATPGLGAVLRVDTGDTAAPAGLPVRVADHRDQQQTVVWRGHLAGKGRLPLPELPPLRRGWQRHLETDLDLLNQQFTVLFDQVLAGGVWQLPPMGSARIKLTGPDLTAADRAASQAVVQALEAPDSLMERTRLGHRTAIYHWESEALELPFVPVGMYLHLRVSLQEHEALIAALPGPDSQASVQEHLLVTGPRLPRLQFAALLPPEHQDLPPARLHATLWKGHRLLHSTAFNATGSDANDWLLRQQIAEQEPDRLRLHVATAMGRIEATVPLPQPLPAGLVPLGEHTLYPEGHHQRVLVLGADGKPLPHARLLLSSPKGHTVEALRGTKQGELLVPLASLTAGHRVHLSAPGHLRRTLILDAGRSLDPVLHLQPGHSLQVHSLLPIAGNGNSIRVQVEALSGTQRMGGRLALNRRTEAAQEASFKSPALEPGGYAISLFGTGGTRLWSQQVELTGDVTLLADLRGRGAVSELKIQDASGHPVPNARLFLLPTSPRRGRILALRSDAGGRLRPFVGFAPGGFLIEAEGFEPISSKDWSARTLTLVRAAR